MNFIIRHRISDLEEEVYQFEVGTHIKYVGFWLSKRKSISEPFGFDWSEFYKEDMERELDAISDNWGDEDVDYWHPKAQARKKVFSKYNPVEQKVLQGLYSSTVARDHPLKVSEELIRQKAIEEISKLEIR